MTEELRRKMEIYNRKASEAERDGYAVIAGKVIEMKPGTPWEMREVCAVGDYVSTAEHRMFAFIARLVSKRETYDGDTSGISETIEYAQEEMVRDWGYTPEQMAMHEAECVAIV